MNEKLIIIGIIILINIVVGYFYLRERHRQKLPEKSQRPDVMKPFDEETSRITGQLKSAIQGDDPYAASKFIESLHSMKEPNEEETKELIKILENENNDPRLRADAATTLGAHDVSEKTAFQLHLKNLDHSAWELRAASAYALGELHENVEIVLPKLLEKLKDSDFHVRSEAIEAIGKYEGQAKQAIALLVFSLKDDEEIVRNSVGEALSHMGEDAKTAIPYLEALLLDSQNNEKVKQSILRTLERIRKE
ncbi:MAG: HEAT repeat domain-containing protein [Deltaproteobacteria bacterium]|nr:HEAT repeat domain-containing protein [Deltaproteobacteria bacterium]